MSTGTHTRTHTVPTIGLIVHVLVDPAGNNGVDVATGLITRVWTDRHDLDTDDLGERVRVNLRVLGDNPDVLWLTSVDLFDERPDEDALAAANPYNPHGWAQTAFWPPKA